MDIPRWLWTVALLIGSNTFMTFAWYYHVKQKAWPLLLAIGISWLIALPEYLLQVPANRLGHIDHGGPFTLAQLKILQEAITLAVFMLFTIYIAKERIRPTDVAAMLLIFAAVAVAMLGRTTTAPAGAVEHPAATDHTRG
ncbi:MAG: DMT family protein [Phycisphaerales bacterium]|nr:DMT family protein [Planctomycetota bacterium]